MKRNHSFIWTPTSLNCAICGEGHHPWDDIGSQSHDESEERRGQRDSSPKLLGEEIDFTSSTEFNSLRFW